ncbi:MAG: PAS domain S-box protein [Gemmatimonadetes bacterium]|nr:PAS domain S-box protein [Gemmatimonadota bacterium]
MNPDGILVMDDHGLIRAVNPSAERIFGYAEGEILGQPLAILIPPRFREAHRTGIERYLATGRRNVPWSGVELIGLAKNGKEVPVEIAFGEYRQGGQHVFAGFVHDITNRVRSQARRQAEHQVTRALSAATDLKTAAPLVLEAICEELGWDFGAFWRCDLEGKKLRCDAVWHRDPDLLDPFGKATKSIALESGEGLPGRVWKVAVPFWITDVLDDENFPRASAAAAVGLHSAFAFPILLGSEVEGVMEFFDRNLEQPDEQLLATVAVIGSDIGQFVRRKQVEAERDLALAKAVIARRVAEDQSVELEAQADELQSQAEELQGVHAKLEAANLALTKANSRLRERTEEAELARGLAEEANRTKSSFLANMSHELRTPINAITGYTDLMELGISGPLTEQQAVHLGRIKASTEHLLGLVNEILDLAKVEAGQLQITAERVEISEIVQEALDLIAPQAAGSMLELSNRVLPEEGHVFWGDGDRVRQILVNLLSNAVKFTGSGGHVTLRVVKTSEPRSGSIPPGSDWIGLEVEDDGIGIPAEKLQSVFEPFEQVDPSHTRERGGTGLGLTISRRLARLMGGDLTVRSEVGQGSCFTIWLPGVPTSSGAPDTGELPSWPRKAVSVPRLGEVGHMLVRCAEDIVQDTAARLRQDPSTREAAELDPAQLGDHTATFLVDIGLALVALDEGGGELALMRDGTQIQRTISHLHGAQRARLGWRADALRREFDILRSVTSEHLRRHLSSSDGATVEDAIAIVRRLLDQAERVSLRGWNRSTADQS